MIYLHWPAVLVFRRRLIAVLTVAHQLVTVSVDLRLNIFFRESEAIEENLRLITQEYSRY